MQSYCMSLRRLQKKHTKHAAPISPPQGSRPSQRASVNVQWNLSGPEALSQLLNVSFIQRQTFNASILFIEFIPCVYIFLYVKTPCG